MEETKLQEPIKLSGEFIVRSEEGQPLSIIIESKWDPEVEARKEKAVKLKLKEEIPQGSLLKLEGDIGHLFYEVTNSPSSKEYIRRYPSSLYAHQLLPEEFEEKAKETQRKIYTINELPLVDEEKEKLRK
ncbi:hypothetical protein HY008_03735 [Candidatus Woesebacteria bacterium]|nr:hypothetical protein [Candidatus Woesebacteria bacterium]